MRQNVVGLPLVAARLGRSSAYRATLVRAALSPAPNAALPARAALLLGIADHVIMTEAAYAFVSGPTMVAEFTGVVIDNVVEIAVDDEEIVQRIAGRRVHEASGRIYHVIYNPPKVAGKDDETGEELIQRADDAADTVKKRLDVYHEQTEVLVGYYSKMAASGDASAPKYVKVPGVGKKTAERLLLELKGKLAPALNKPGFAAVSDSQGDILQALIALGYSDKEAQAALKQLPADVSVSDGIKQALKALAR